METTYTYKKQGNGKDSWTCEIKDGETLIDRYMVYEDPNIIPVPSVDIVALLQSQPPEVLEQIKQLLS